MRSRPRPTAVAAVLLTLVAAGQVAVVAVLLDRTEETDLALTFVVNAFVAVLLVGSATYAWLALRRRGLEARWRTERREHPTRGAVDTLTGVPTLDAPPREHRGLTGEQEPPRRW